MSSTNKTTNLKLNKWIGTDRSAREDFNNDNDLIDKFAGEVTASLKDLANGSLLINSDFQVWQRGTSFSANNGGIIYTADRWRMISDAGIKVTKQDYGVSVETISVGDWHNFEQYMELPKYLQGEKVTVSIKLHSKGVIKQFYAGVKNANLGGEKALVAIFNSTVENLFTYTFTIPTGDYAILYLGVQTEEKVGARLEIEYIKLELGSKPTPFVPRPFCEELALCKRYYELFNATCTIGDKIGNEPNKHHISSVPYTVEKRTVPTVTYGGINWIYVAIVPNTALSSDSASNTRFLAPIFDTTGYDYHGVNLVIINGSADAEIY